MAHCGGWRQVTKKMGGGHSGPIQGTLTHNFRFKYIKNYLENKKSKYIKNFNLIFFKFSRKKIFEKKSKKKFLIFFFLKKKNFKEKFFFLLFWKKFNQKNPKIRENPRSVSQKILKFSTGTNFRRNVASWPTVPPPLNKVCPTKIYLHFCNAKTWHYSIANSNVYYRVWVWWWPLVDQSWYRVLCLKTEFYKFRIQ